MFEQKKEFNNNEVFYTIVIVLSAAISCILFMTGLIEYFSSNPFIDDTPLSTNFRIYMKGMIVTMFFGYIVSVLRQRAKDKANDELKTEFEEIKSIIETKLHMPIEHIDKQLVQNEDGYFQVESNDWRLMTHEFENYFYHGDSNTLDVPMKSFWLHKTNSLLLMVDCKFNFNAMGKYKITHSYVRPISKTDFFNMVDSKSYTSVFGTQDISTSVIEE